MHATNEKFMGNFKYNLVPLIKGQPKYIMKYKEVQHTVHAELYKIVTFNQQRIGK